MEQDVNHRFRKHFPTSTSTQDRITQKPET